MYVMIMIMVDHEPSISCLDLARALVLCEMHLRWHVSVVMIMLDDGPSMACHACHLHEP